MNQEPGQAYEDPGETRDVEEDKEHPGDQAFEDPDETKKWEDDK
ncbi:MAG: hypothetical protein ACRDZ0_13100 [Acidimicrobiales bacterium]